MVDILLINHSLIIKADMNENQILVSVLPCTVFSRTIWQLLSFSAFFDLVCAFAVVKVGIFWHLPTPKCKRNLWKLPNWQFYKKKHSFKNNLIPLISSQLVVHMFCCQVQHQKASYFWIPNKTKNRLIIFKKAQKKIK